MHHVSTLPFILRRGDDVYDASEITSTKETVHGLLRLDGECLHVQWRTHRATDRYGRQIRTDHEYEPVREASVPLRMLAGARIRWAWLRWPPGYFIELTAADLRAFEALAGEDGLRLAHPARLGLPIARGALLAAREFASELQLALADRALRAAESAPPLTDGSA